MAAETLTAARAAASFPVFQSHESGSVCAAWGSYDISANVEDGDIFEMCKIPAGATIIGGWIYADDLDTGTEALDLDVGWAANGVESADSDGLGNLGTLTGDAVTGIKPEVGTSMPLGGKLLTAGPQKFTKRTTIQIEANTPANTFAAGTISLIVYYLN